jgi:serine/threonine protein phosphatase PrpC
MRLRVGAATDTGRVRQVNEDAYASRAGQGFFVVCDGMGGKASGEVASRLAVQSLVDHLNGGQPEPAGADTAGEAGYRPETIRLADAVRRANQCVYHHAQQNARDAGMGTTLVGAWIAHGIASLAHVGDSRAYLWRNGELEPLTQDHSLVDAQVRAGLLTREESLQSEQQNVLLRALGLKPEVEVDIDEVPVRAGDYLMLCSDGLTRMVAEPELAGAISRLRDPQRICDDLIETANRNGGVDNTTVVVVQVQAGWWQRLWDRRRGQS